MSEDSMSKVRTFRTLAAVTGDRRFAVVAPVAPRVSEVVGLILRDTPVDSDIHESILVAATTGRSVEDIYETFRASYVQPHRATWPEELPPFEEAVDANARPAVETAYNVACCMVQARVKEIE